MQGEKMKPMEIKMLNFPRWFWWVLSLVLVIIVCVVFKINLVLNIGSAGISGGLTQGLIQ